MPTFTYAAIDAATGHERTGMLDSVGEEAAITELKARGLYPTVLAPVKAAGAAKLGAPPAQPRQVSGGGNFQPFRRRVGRNDLMVFTRQLAALAGAGMPLVRGLDLLARQERNPAWQVVIAGLADAIRSGGTFSDGLARHPKIFDRLYVGMIKAAESGGLLAVVLERLARHLEKSAQIKGRVQSALTYPVVIIVVAVSIVAALMAFVVPKFEKIFTEVLKGAPLPALTRGVLATSRFVQGHWLLILGAIVLAGMGWRWLRATGAGARAFDRLLIRLPVLGGLFLKTAVARFSRTLGTMLMSGVPILQALQLTRDATGNRLVAEGIETVYRRVREGENVTRPLAETGVFPPVVAGLVEVGEETGTLPAMLGRLADMYDEEVDNTVSALTSLIEPVMIVLMAVIVGTIVIALFLPIVRIIQLMT
jgi:type IV pilus assembly protein PilC